MRALIEAHDWSTTLGPRREWSESLRNALGIVLACPEPMIIWWGQDLIQLYNDAQRRSMPPGHHPAALGQRALDFWRDLRHFIAPPITQVMSGQGAVAGENQRVSMVRDGRVENTYWTYSYTPIEEPTAPNGVGGVLVIWRETSTFYAAERRQSFRMALWDRLRDLSEARAVMAAAAELLGRHLAADRAGYAEIADDGKMSVVDNDWCAPRMPSLAGRHRLDDFGPALIAEFRAGRTVAFEDVLTETLTSGETVAATFAAASTSAAITAPLIKGGRFAAALYVHQRTPRRWTEEDEALVRDVAERTWAAVERARAETALRESQAYWRGMFTRLHEGFLLAEIIRDPAGAVVDWRYLDVNPVWEELFGVEPGEAVGRTVRELAPALFDTWVDVFSRVADTGEIVSYCRLGSRHDRWYEGHAFRTGPDQFAALFLDVTERKHGEQKLRSSEERARLALESGELGIWEVDIDTGKTQCSARYDEIFGYTGTRPDWTYLMFESHLIAEDRQTARNLFRAATKSGESSQLTCRITRVDGEHRWIELRCKPFPDPNGRVTRILGTIADITERHEAQQRLEALNESLEREVITRTADRDRFWRLSSDLMVMVRYDGVIVSVNPAWTALLGWAESELVGRKLFEFIHPDFVRASRSRPAELPPGASVWAFDNRYRRKDGQYRWISWTAVPGDGLVAAVGRDVTDEKAKSAALEQSEARLRSVFETSFQFQGLLTPEGNLVDANPMSLSATESDLADIRGVPFWRTPWFLATPGMPEQIEAAVAVAAGGGSVRREITLNLPNGRRIFDFSLRPVLNPAGAVIGIVPEAMETTERRAIEEQLRQSQKMEAVGQLTGGLAHDFNNLLTGIIGSLELMQNRVEQGRVNDLQRFISGAQGAASRAAALTHRLLAFSRRQTLDPKPTQANRLIAGMAELIQRTVGPAITVETRLSPDLWPVLCDPNQLESALLNLCINARDAMPDGGRLTITTERSYVDDRTAPELDVAPGDYIIVGVGDTGTGMAPNVLARAFDPFFTTKPIGMGTGLGLSMIYGFARQSDGHVQLSSVEGQGTLVRLYLPRRDGEPAEDLPRLELRAAPRAGSGETVLVVDDEALVRTLVTEVLEELGYTAIEAADGAAGLKVLRSDVTIDLLISDVGLPGGMNGRQMADAARRERPDLKVLFITGYADGAVMGDGQLEPGMHLITKPFAMETMATRIKAILDGR
jgi:PAS domain S-box-containing protein